MDKKILLVSICLFLLCSVCYGEVVYLKNGKTIQGRIVEQTDSQIKLEAFGVTMTYYMDEVDRIEGEQQPMPSKGTGNVQQLPVLNKMQPIITQPLNSDTGKDSLADNTFITFEIDPSLMTMSKKDLIAKYIETSGIKEAVSQLFDQLINQQTPEDAQQLKAIFDVDEIIAQFAPIYDKYFIEEDLRGLIAFYHSKLGRKLLKTTPLIKEDSARISSEYSQKKMSQ